MNRGLKQICRELVKLADRIEEDLRARQPETAPQAAGLFMFAKGYKSFQVSRLLFKEGFWQDAASISRTLLELGFQARWLNKDPEAAGPLFLRHESRDRLKLLRGLKSNASPAVKIRAAASLEKLSSEADFDTSWRTWWSKESNIEQLARELELSPTYDLLYRPLCWFVHSSPFAMNYYLREEDGRVIFDCRPAEPPLSNKNFAEMLFSAAPTGLEEVLAAVDTVFALGRQPEFDRIRVLFKNHIDQLAGKVENRRGTKPLCATRACE